MILMLWEIVIHTSEVILEGGKGVCLHIIAFVDLI
jgi:hypothetical protein